MEAVCCFGTHGTQQQARRGQSFIRQIEKEVTRCRGAEQWCRDYSNGGQRGREHAEHEPRGPERCEDTFIFRPLVSFGDGFSTSVSGQDRTRGTVCGVRAAQLAARVTAG